MKLKMLLISLCYLSTFLYGQYEIPANVFGNGGSLVSNSNLKLNSTIGQTLILEKTQSNNFQLEIGFWRPAKIITPVEEFDNLIPKEYRLEQNYPNPFNPSTTISYQIPEESKVILIMYDIIGREIEILVNDVKDAGVYKINFNATNLASGIYFYRLEAKSNVSDKHYTEVGKMMLLK